MAEVFSEPPCCRWIPRFSNRDEQQNAEANARQSIAAISRRSVIDSTADRIKDIGAQPQSFDIERATKENTSYRSVAWSGRHPQVTLMSIPVGRDIGLEADPETDPFLRLDAGSGRVQMEAAKITDRKAGFRSLGDTWADTTTSHGRPMLTLLGGSAELERGLICVRRGEGSARTVARGVKMRRPPKLTPHQYGESWRAVRTYAQARMTGVGVVGPERLLGVIVNLDKVAFRPFRKTEVSHDERRPAPAP